ncbi:MAG: CoA transferase [Deltaproteobacteria bacterium]|nr:CoA transferase [Deltaproteobacteria bacterium]
MAGKALEGIRVLELAHVVAGPYCAKLLSDLGSDTIKIEAPGTGDETRTSGPFPGDIPHPEKSGLFLYLNTNKRGITLNVQSKTGRDLFLKLVGWADILIEDRSPGEMEEMALTYEDLKALNPDLIMVSITPFGQTGPYRNYKAYPLNSFHAGGESMNMYYMNQMVNPSDRAPLNGPGFMGECDAGLSGATGAMAALYSRGAGGRGQHIDISKQESSIAIDRLQNVLYHNQDKEETQLLVQASIQGAGMVGGLLSCKDGYVVLAAMQDNQWAGLVDLMGNPDWTKEERFVSEESRAIHAREATAKVQEWMMDHTMEEIFRGGQQRGVPVGAVTKPEDLVHSPQMRHRGFFAEIDHPVAGRFEYPTAAYKLSETPWAAWRPAPLLGQHNEEIFTGLLNCTKEDLVALRRLGVI